MSELGLVLVLVGAALVAVEAHVPTHGVLGSGAVAAIAAGVALLLAGTGIVAAVAVAVGLMIALIGATALWLTVRQLLGARRARIRSGAESLIGRVGVVRCVPAPFGQVFVDGALWRARLWGLEPEEERELGPGDAVVVERVDGLTLTVRPAEEWELVP
jgi:membrane-bound ClpP family serine protease